MGIPQPMMDVSFLACLCHPPTANTSGEKLKLF